MVQIPQKLHGMLFLVYNTLLTHKPSILLGVSAGSINAMSVAQFAIGDELNMTNWLRKF